MSDSGETASNKYLVANRECGTCTACCRQMAIDAPELKKAPGVLCVHCVENKGCSIHETLPQTCRVWFCGWRQMPQLDDSWRPDRCEILISVTDQNIPAGYPRLGLTFELTGSLNRVNWPPLLQVLAPLIANSVPVFLSVRGAPATISTSAFLNDELSGAVALGDPEMAASMLRGLLKACLAFPKYEWRPGGAGKI